MAARNRYAGGTAGTFARELVELAAAPVVEAVGAGDPVDLLYDPDATDLDVRTHGGLSDDPADLVGEVERHLAWAAALDGTPFAERGELTGLGRHVTGLMLRGSVRAALRGVHEGVTSEVRGYADGAHAFVLAEQPGHTEAVLADFGKLPDLLTAKLPDVPLGESGQLRLAVDDHGFVRSGQEDGVCLLRDVLARPRSGTAVLDLLAFGGLCAEFPDHGFVLLDTDLGRFALCDVDAGTGCRQLVFAPFSGGRLRAWLRRMTDLDVEQSA